MAQITPSRFFDSITLYDDTGATLADHVDEYQLYSRFFDGITLYDSAGTFSNRTAISITPYVFDSAVRFYYIMRAYYSSTSSYVYWYAGTTPDLTGVSSGLTIANLSDIVIVNVGTAIS